MLGPVVDVAIGLVLVFLLIGLIASALQEIVARVLQWRGKGLRAGLENLLDAGTNSGLFQKVYQHPLVNCSPASGRLPSYLSARNFAIALTDSLRNNSGATVLGQMEQSVGTLPPRLKCALEALLRDADGDYGAFRSRVEKWYDDAMDRISGYYKRRSQTFALAFGMVVAVILNVDSIGIARALWVDPQKRALVVESAQLYMAAPQSGTMPIPTQSNGPTDATPDVKRIEAAFQQLNQLPLPVGWTVSPPGDKTIWKVADRQLVHSGWGGPLKVIGWLATALAVSLGAPFWFDTLQKFLNIRSAGPSPARSSR